MVKWVSAQGYTSPISGMLEKAGAALWGDTLTPALKKEQLLKAQRENAGAQNMMDLFREVGNAASTQPRPAAPVASPPIVGREDFLSKIAPAAIGVGQRTGLDPRLIVAQSALETGWGKSAPGNNFFGIKSHGAPGGQMLNTTEVVNGQPVNIADAFRTYDSPESSVHGYGDFVTSNPRYGDMLSAQGLDAQLAALGRSGYATDPNYADKVGSIARALDLGQYMPAATPSGMNGAPATDGTYNPLNAPQFYGELGARAIEGGMKPQEAADLARMFMSGTFGAENQAATDAFVGAGGDYARTYSGFASDQNRMERDSVRDNATTMRGQDVSAATAMAKDENDIQTVIRDGVAVPVRKSDLLPTDRAVLSDSQQKGLTADGIDMTPAQQLAYVGAEPKTPPQADSYIATDGTIYRSVDGMTDAATGQPLPSDAIKTSVVSADRASAGLDKVNNRDIEAQALAGRKFKGTIERARAVASAAGPTAFGIIGRARSIGQDVQSAIDAASGGFSEDLRSSIAATEQSLQDMAAQGDPVAAKFLKFDYDPNLTSLEMYARLLPYEAAAAIAGQTGRGLSDNDVKRFQAIVGDPLSFFGSQKAFMTTLDTIEAEVNARLGENQALLSGGRDAVLPEPPAPAASGGGAPTITSDAEYEALPSGTEFIAPDGSRRRKP